MYIGWIIAGFGALLLLLNGMAARHDDPKANQQAGLLAVFLIVVGLVIQAFTGGF